LSWDAVGAEVRAEMRLLAASDQDAARAVLEKLRAAYLESEQERRKQRTLLAMRRRLQARAPIVCPLCRATFVPYRSDTLYCTVACRKNASAQRAYRVRRADARKHGLHLQRRRALHAVQRKGRAA
jgi:hypothetical protein